MRHSQFWALLDDVFGEAYAGTLARELALDALDSRTCRDALDDGVPPRDVWHALCDQMDIPMERRDGGRRERAVPPPR
ncbi:DUF3046 domain-containing protein [Demequina sp. NBRC 110053]|uniref:DUF3046 domain-containing protein n=1 Tax=Demequina sp. NBRC 110053 TaxID=1570342 RepID=UPI0009FD5051|nr:DUF3046 domain-containing protein [Demequina sp. NBRC 110053]